MKITIDINSLTSLESLTEKDSVRYYNNGVWFCGDKAVASDSMVLLESRAQMEDTEYSEHHAGVSGSGGMLVKKEALKRELTIAKAQGKTAVDFVPGIHDVICGEFPPYEAAFPTNPQELATFDLDLLIKALQAIKKITKGSKNVKVSLTAEPNHSADRAWLVTVPGHDAKLLITPFRK